MDIDFELLPQAYEINHVFVYSIEHWHLKNSRTHLSERFESKLPYALLNLIWEKNQIDTEQWHEEDKIRSPEIGPYEFITTKRKIDQLNQERVDVVEKMDDWFLDFFRGVKPLAFAQMNSESPAWLIDKMSILQLKIYHMSEQTMRLDASIQHKEKCQSKLNILLEQQVDLSQCLDHLLKAIMKGEKYMKVYRQMKMYNDPTLNPALYQAKA